MKVTQVEIARVWAPGLPEALDPEGSLDPEYPPVILGPVDEDGEHELIDGFHRVRAARADGLTKIWAIIVTPKELDRLVIMSEADWIRWIQEEAEAAAEAEPDLGRGGSSAGHRSGAPHLARL